MVHTELYMIHAYDEDFFFLKIGLESKFSKKIKEREATKNHMQQSKSYKQ